MQLVNLDKTLIGVEDIYFSLTTQTQRREGQDVVVTGINATSIPVNEANNISTAWTAVADYQTYIDTYGAGITNLSDNLTDIIQAHADLVANGWVTTNITVANAVEFEGNSYAAVLNAAEAQTIAAADIKYDHASGEIRRDDDTPIVINASTLGGSDLATVKSDAVADAGLALDIKYNNASGEIRRNDNTPIVIDAATLGGLTATEIQNAKTGFEGYNFVKLLNTELSFSPDWMIGVTEDNLLIHWGRETNFVNGSTVEVSDGLGVSLVPSPLSETGTVSKIVACPRAWFVLYSTGNLYGIGDGTNGQLGQGNTDNQSELVLILANVQDFVCTSSGNLPAINSCYAIDTSGNLWSWGYNGVGQLGHDDTSNRLSPTQVTISGLNVGEVVSKVYCVQCSKTSAYVITSEGRVFSCGYNGTEGSLGLGDTTDRDQFEVVSGGGLSTKTVTKLVVSGGEASSTAHSVIAYTSDNLIYFWGHGLDGQAGQGNNLNYSSPIQITATPNTGNWTNVFGTSSGNASFFAISSSNELWGWGRNRDGCLGVGNSSEVTSLTQITLTNEDLTTNTSGVNSVMVSSGTTLNNRQTTVLITNDNKVFASGRNNRGQCGNNSSTDITTFEQMRIPAPEDIIQLAYCGNGSSTSLFALYSNGRVIGWGDNVYQQANVLRDSGGYCPVPQLTHF